MTTYQDIYNRWDEKKRKILDSLRRCDPHVLDYFIIDGRTYTIDMTEEERRECKSP